MFDLVILDLNMPISDGFDACSKIQKLYNQRKKIDFNQTSQNPIKKNSTHSAQLSAINSNQATVNDTQQFHIRLEDYDLLPLIVALTSHIDTQVLEKCDKAGFMMTLLTPLK